MTAIASTWDVPRERQEPVPSERWAYGAVGVLVALLGVIGFANSFEAVQAAAQPSFGPLAWSVPLGIDLGIAVFVALDLVMTRTGMRTRWVRLVPWGLTAATIWLNVSGQHDAVGTVAHAVLPMLWVLAVEVGAHIARHRFGLGTARPARTRLDRVRLSRWVLAPLSTGRLRRRMILWEEASYSSALGRERDRLLALCGLRDQYGPVAWRWKAPRAERVLFRLGDVPDRSRPALPSLPPVPPPVPDRAPSPVPNEDEAVRSRPVPDADLMTAARAVRDGLGRVPGRDVLARSLRDRGHPVGTARAGELVSALKAEATP